MEGDRKMIEVSIVPPKFAFAIWKQSLIDDS